MSASKNLLSRIRNSGKTFRRIKMRTHLNADTLYARIHGDFAKVKDHRASNTKIPLSDILSGFALFAVKDPSLLAFDERRKEDPDSLHTVFGIGDNIPCDSQMRFVLDPVSPISLRRPFTNIFA